MKVKIYQQKCDTCQRTKVNNMMKGLLQPILVAAIP